ncbi:Rhodanese-like protein [Pluteus cervinus]|uniref:Rhodanese-like protein n=1 Tax=Pluteus cervinus TaxID=181527 RepID=A0ACD3B721_9AGAR|nr:Rhodanese-like protein [Pluteus cervinus]
MRYIAPNELADLIKAEGKVATVDYIVVDVRDDDYVGGNIKGALNQPSGEFLQNVDVLVKATKDVPLVIFHCALSQVRGPKAARIYEETRNNILGPNDAQEVKVLRSGFTGFQARYWNDPDLVENWSKTIWGGDWDNN